jgi:hypothetical protein
MIKYLLFDTATDQFLYSITKVVDGHHIYTTLNWRFWEGALILHNDLKVAVLMFDDEDFFYKCHRNYSKGVDWEMVERLSVSNQLILVPCNKIIESEQYEVRYDKAVSVNFEDNMLYYKGKK